jgi:predicted regulator of Ras-like GTPase activity (Roadblock/LC7/MglB family)
MSDHLSSRAARLDRALSDLLTQAPELEAAAVVSFDGLAMASALPLGMDEDRVAAMSAALLSLGEKAAQGLGRGDLSQVYVEGETGTVFLVSADDEAVLVAVAAAGAKAGLMLYEVRRSAAQIAEVLRTEAPAPAAAVNEAALAEAEAAYAAHKAAQARAAQADAAAAVTAAAVAAQIQVPVLVAAPPPVERAAEIVTAPVEVASQLLVAPAPAPAAVIAEIPVLEPVVAEVPVLAPVVAEVPVLEPVVAEIPVLAPVAADVPVLEPLDDAPADREAPAASSPVVMPITHSTAPGPRTGTFFPEVTSADVPVVPDSVPENLTEAAPSLSLAPWETPPPAGTWS